MVFPCDLAKTRDVCTKLTYPRCTVKFLSSPYTIYVISASVLSFFPPRNLHSYLVLCKWELKLDNAKQNWYKFDASSAPYSFLFFFFLFLIYDHESQKTRNILEENLMYSKICDLIYRELFLWRYHKRNYYVTLKSINSCRTQRNMTG